jgi:hypothetical protein
MQAARSFVVSSSTLPKFLRSHVMLPRLFANTFVQKTNHSVYRFNPAINFGTSLSRRFCSTQSSGSSTQSSGSSTQSSGSSTQSSGSSEIKLKELLIREEFQAVRKKLEEDPREQISLEEYNQICKTFGLNEQESARLCSSLSDSGIIFYLSTARDPVLSKTVFLKPQKISELIHAAFGENKLFTGAKSVEEYEKMKEEYKEMLKLKEQLDKKSFRRANFGIAGVGAYMILQAAVLARLTWWEFSWDIMEPITYFVSFSSAIVGWMYFAIHRSEYTYENLRDSLARRRRNKLYIKYDFNEERFNQLEAIFHKGK